MKTFLNASTTLARKFKRDEDGATALAFALGLTVMLGAIGAGMDISVANKSKSKAQHIADSVSLNAAAYIRDHDEPPTSDSEGFMDGKVYTASALGYDFGELTNGNVTIQVDYDLDNGEAVTRVSGATQTTFTSFFGFDKFDFASTSTVKFLSNQIQQPVSIAVVADNSGSMHFHDKPTPFNNNGNPIPRWDTAPRINGLQTALINFRDEVAAVAGEQTGTDMIGKRTVRMGLLPYSDDVISNSLVSMDWGYLQNGDINDMEPTSGTDSSPPMQQAETWMGSETSIHMSETQRDPLRYVVFMTDGQNTTPHWVPDNNASFFRRPGCFGQDWDDPLGCDYDRRLGQSFATFDRAWLDRNDYEDTSDATLRGWGWDEGRYEVLGDSLTLASCNRMKADGVRIFTIGFALGQGQFFTGNWRDNPDREQAYHYRAQSPDASAKANALMSSCASEGDFFVADDNTSLQNAFTNIGLKIKREVIRLSN